MAQTEARSLGERWQNNTMSSAYRDTSGMGRRGCSCCSTPSSMACLISLPSVSTARMNSCGDRGSPCRSPRRCQIGGPGSPLSNTIVLAVESRIASRSRNCVPKPYWCRTSNKNGQEIVSKDFARSSFSQ
jgi:hypothetical protein